MAQEFKIGRLRFTWRGQWAAAVTYNRDAIVQYQGKSYVCLTPHTSATNFYDDLNFITGEGGLAPRWDLVIDGRQWRDEWQPNTFYSLGNIVKYGGRAYLCVEQHTSGSSQIDISKWDTYSSYDSWNVNWSTGTVYGVGDIVKYGGIVYRCIQNHLSSVSAAQGLETDQSKWEIVHEGLEYKSNWTAATRYKKNDLAKVGAGLYVCSAGHTSGSEFQDANWSLWMPGAEYTDTWTETATYQPGDIVKYGGYSYLNKIVGNSGIIPSMNATEWELITQGYRVRNNWDGGVDYHVGDLVRRAGTLFVALVDSTGEDPVFYEVNKTYEATGSSGTTVVLDSTSGLVPGMTLVGNGFLQGQTISKVVNATTIIVSDEPNREPIDEEDILIVGVNYTNWSILVPSNNWRSFWIPNTSYSVGELVVWANATYQCIRNHSSSNLFRPDVDADNEYWVWFVRHDPANAGNTAGDIVTVLNGESIALPIIDPDSQTTGETEDYMLRVVKTGDDIQPAWREMFLVPRVFYVTTEGQDTEGYGHTWDKPFNSIKYACEQSALGNTNLQAEFLLRANKEFLVREMWEWMLNRKENNQAPFTSSSVFDEFSTKRDAKLVIDALLYDITRGSNSKTVYTTLAFFAEGSTTSFRNEATDDAQEYIVAALTQLKTIIQYALEQDEVLTNYQQINRTWISTDTYNEDDVIYYQGFWYSSLINDNISREPGVAENWESDWVIIPTPTYIDPQVFNNAYQAEPSAYIEITSLMDILISAIQDANTKNVPLPNYGITTSIFVKTGTYFEDLPISLPDNTALIGDELRGVVVRPKNSFISYTTLSLTSVSAFKLQSVENLEVNDPIQFVAATVNDDFGGITTGQTYYVKSINTLTKDVSISLTPGGDILPIPNGSGYMRVYAGNNLKDMFYVRNATGIRNMTLAGLEGTLTAPNSFGTRRPTGGAYVSLDPGTGPNDTSVWIMKRSPYIQNVTTFGNGCVGYKVDGTLHNGGNKSITTNDFTQVISDGIGCWCTGTGSLTEAVSVFSYYAYAGYFAEDGGRIRATNGNSSYGTFGVIAEGFDPEEDPVTALVDNRSSQVQAIVQSAFGVNAEILSMQYANAGSNYFEQTTNLLKYSNEFLNGIWISDGNLTLQKNLVSPTGETNAWTVAGLTSNTDTSYLYQNISIAPPGANYTSLDALNITGSGIGSLFDVVVGATEYTVTVNTGGGGYVVGNQLRILGSQLGGVDGDNDCIITVVTLSGSSIATVTATGTVPTNSNLKYTLSLHVKRGTAQLIDLYGIFSGTSTVSSGVSYNFETEIITTYSEGGGLTPVEYGAVELPNGWYRLWMRIYDTNAFNNNLQFRIYPRGKLGFSGTTRIYGAQIQIGTGLTFYANTTTNNITTNADYVITGAGIDAVAIGDELRGGAVFEGRIVDTGTGTGGRGYLVSSNNGQTGDEVTFTIAQSDIGEANNYVGMRLFIQSGTGAGQYGYIADFNAFNKTAAVVKDSFDLLNVGTTENSSGLFTLSSGNTSTLYVDQQIRFIPTYYSTNITDTSNNQLQIIETFGGQDNWIVVSSTALLTVNMPIRFIGTPYGGVTTGFTYYIREILDGTRFTISTEQFGTIWNLSNAEGDDEQDMYMVFPGYTSYLIGLTTNMLPNMPIQFTGLALGGITIGDTYYVNDVISSTQFTVSTNLVTISATATNSANGRITCDSTVSLVPLNPIVFSGSVFGGISVGQKYYITNIAGGTEFTITPTLIEVDATATQAVTNLITVTSTAGFVANAPIKFIGNTFGGIVTGNIYYILAVNDGVSFTISGVPGGSSVNLATATGLMYAKTSDGLVSLSTASGTMVGTSTNARSSVSFGFGSMTATFSTNLFGGVTSDQEYFIKTIDSDTQFSVSTTQGGLPLTLISNTGSMNVAAAGWDHINPGTPIESTLDNSCIYFIEPRITFLAPGFTQEDSQTNALATGSEWIDIEYGNGFFMAVPDGQQTIGRSVDGETWTPITLPVGDQWSGIAYGNSYWVIIAYSGGATATQSTALVSKSNGDGWKRTTLPTKSGWNKVVYGNSKFVAIATYIPANNDDPMNPIPAVNATAAYSTDFGNTWVTGTGLTTSASWTGLCYGAGKFVAVASGGTSAALSTNGTSWSITTLPASEDWSDVAYGNGVFVAISSTVGKPAFSTDGQTWQQSAYEITGTKICYGQGVFLVLNANSDIAWTSEDGFNWKRRTVTSDPYGAVTFGWVEPSKDGAFVTVSGQNNATLIKAGAKTKGRVTVTSNRITGVAVWEPGSNYASAPTITIRDPNVTVNASIIPRISNGTLGNPTFLNRGQGYNTTSTAVAIRGGGYADKYQTGLTLTVKNLTRLPGPGDNLVIQGNDQIYKITGATAVFGTVAPNIQANITVGPEIRSSETPDHETPVLIRTKYSQARLTGHDYLYIGYGNFEQTNYPDVPEETVLAPQDQAVEVNFGRVFYTSTDQDGNFKVGDLFGVEQATGIVTLSASQFGLSGLETLSLGGIAVGQASVVIRQFSTDSTFIANSNELIPTQKAIKSYLTSRLSQGGSNTFTGQLIAGTVLVGGPDKIQSTIPAGIPGSVVNMPNTVNVQGEFAGWDGDGMAYQFFVNQWVRPGAL
jgi:hypothetical protein